MDPLSVTMAIVGLLTAAQQISSAIGTVVSKSKSAPKDMQSVKSTVDTIRSVLLQLQLLLIGRTKVDRHRTSLILVDQVVITLSACVTTFSELDVFVGSLHSDADLGLMDRFRWATKAKTIQEHLQKLEMHKSSLTLMMTILTCESTYKAEDAVDELSLMARRSISCSPPVNCIKPDVMCYMKIDKILAHSGLLALLTIRQVLDNQQVLAERMSSIEIGSIPEKSLAPELPKATEQVPENVQRNAGGFAFEEVLQNSWVYKRSIKVGDTGAFSVISAAGRTASWSMLSGLSLSDNISIIAVQALPVYAHDVSNSEVYQFGEFEDSEVELQDNALASDVSPRSRSSRWRFDRITAGLTVRLPRKISSRGTHEQHGATVNDAIPRVFGVPLRECIVYANVAISLCDLDGKSYIYGYVPIIVAKIGVFLKEKGTTTENIFARSISAKRIRELQVIFDSPDRYGKGLDWETGWHKGLQPGTETTGHSVYDAASCLLRYVKLLPEPVIPYDLYDQFTATVQDEEDLPESVSIAALQELIKLLPPLNRQLLLYLLDLLAVFASKSETNLMTSERLVAAFQPGLLSQRPSEMTAEDHIQAARTMVFMIENQDHFLIGMTGSDSAVKDSSKDESESKTASVSTVSAIRKNQSLMNLKVVESDDVEEVATARPRSSSLG